MARYVRNDDEDDDRTEKPRNYGITEMRGALYSRSQATHQSIHDTLEIMGQFVDGLRFSGGSYSIEPRSSIKEIIQMAHKHNVYVSSGDWAEQVLREGPAAFKAYIEDCREMGFDLIEPNSSLIRFSEEALLRLVRMIKNAGLRARPCLSWKFDLATVPASGDRAFGAYIHPVSHESGMIEDVDLFIRKAERCLEAGAEAIMIAVEDDAELATDVIARLVGRLGLDRTIFEAIDGPTAEWFVMRYGPKVNLLVDHSQIMGLECLRNHYVGRRRRSIPM